MLFRSLDESCILAKRTLDKHIDCQFCLSWLLGVSAAGQDALTQKAVIRMKAYGQGIVDVPIRQVFGPECCAFEDEAATFPHILGQKQSLTDLKPTVRVAAWMAFTPDETAYSC